jgi:hypothetical protein
MTILFSPIILIFKLYKLMFMLLLTPFMIVYRLYRQGWIRRIFRWAWYGEELF